MAAKFEAKVLQLLEKVDRRSSSSGGAMTEAAVAAPVAAPVATGKYICQKIVWDPCMRGQYYVNEKRFFLDLLARLEMVRAWFFFLFFFEFFLNFF